MMKKTPILLTLILAGFSLFAQEIDYKAFPEWAWGKEDSTEYFLYTPTNLELGKRYPIVLFMHGCCGEDLKASARNAVDPPARMWHNFGANEQSVPTYIISAKTNRGWSKHFESLKKVMDFLVEKRQGDPQRIYVTGFSMGGRGTFEFISQYPDYFAAALPMGMSFFDGDFEKIKNVPVWTNQGAEDWWSRELYRYVKDTRVLNGLELDTAAEWITGVNPRYTSFKGVGHGVQWHAASTQDLTGWAYSKINDGNQYPIVYFETPEYRQEVKARKAFKVAINAIDPDGSIDKVDIYLNRKFHSSLTKSPYTTRVTPEDGDNLLEAIAADDKGKTSTATSILVVDNKPEIPLSILPYGSVGAYYSYWVPASGNGELNFTAAGLPEGLILLSDGLIKGIPIEKGNFNIEITVVDTDGDAAKHQLDMEVKASRDGEILVTNAEDVNGSQLQVSKLIYQEVPNFVPDDEPASFIEEINFSCIGDYYGLTFIKTDLNDSTPATDNYMTFDINQPANLLIGYEKRDQTMTSTQPEWLSDFTKEESEVAAQYRYFGVYSKAVEKGKITLPGGDKKGHDMAFNYFVMVQPGDFSNQPEINSGQLPVGRMNTWYQAQLSALYGHGKLKWKLVSGTLPEGLKLQSDGTLEGLPLRTGTFKLMVQVQDEKGQSNQQEVELGIK